MTTITALLVDYFKILPAEDHVKFQKLSQLITARNHYMHAEIDKVTLEETSEILEILILLCEKLKK
jgi:hypothetical protein